MTSHDLKDTNGEHVVSVTVLRSSSSGNATLIRNGRHAILVDCGLGPRVTEGLLKPLLPPVVGSDRPNILVAAMRGKDTIAAVAVDETHPPAEIIHPWSFWMSTYLAIQGNLTFDKPYVVYDLLR